MTRNCSAGTRMSSRRTGADNCGSNCEGRLVMSNDHNLTDKLKAEAEKAAGKARDDGRAAHEKLDDAEAKLEADVHKHSSD